jgi:ATP-dependent Clp protease ATP-binding subunit ClpB
VLRKHFRPEFLNRLDGILNFHPLRREDMAQILDVQLGRVGERLAGRDIQLELTPRARDLLAERGYDPAFGARPLKRLLQHTLLDPLASEILAGKLRPGTKVLADATADKDGELQITLRPAHVKAACLTTATPSPSRQRPRPPLFGGGRCRLRMR